MNLAYEDTLREITTDAGVLRYHEAGPPTGCRCCCCTVPAPV